MSKSKPLWLRLTRRRAGRGSVDVLIALAGAGGSAMSGVVMAAAGYDLLGLGGAALAFLLIPVVAIRSGRGRTLPG